MAQDSGIWEHSLEHAALSDVGLRRSNNQDAMTVVLAESEETWQRRGHLMMVADGMGAHAAGELASKLAADTVALSYFKLVDLPPPDAILKATIQANQRIHDRGEADPEFKGMGTTSTALLLLPQGALVAHVGDSRAYRLRGNRLEQLTFDHSLIWEMQATGQLAAHQIEDLIPKNIITRSLGPAEEVQIDLEGPFPIAAGDTFLLCSDGLSGVLEDGEIGTILGSMPPAEAVSALVDLANLRGGPDNITVIVARVNEVPPPPTEPARGAARRRGSAEPVHPVVWMLLGLSCLATGGVAAMQHWVPALLCLLGAVLAAAAVLVQRSGGREIVPEFDRRPLGTGPHRAFTCAADAHFVEQLGLLVEELREAATREDWSVDWSQFDVLLGQAVAAEEAADHAGAVREYFRAVHFVMAQLKRQRASDGNEGSRTGPL